jgi:acetylornithine deacetylase
MDIFQLTRALVDIESTTNSEARVADFLFEYLAPLVEKFGGTLDRQPVELDRVNILACWDEPRVTLSTHMDTVPPFFSSREDDEFIYGRGSCDAKGIIAAMIEAASRLLTDGIRNIGLLFVVGEEKNGAGALAAAKDRRGSRFIICGEPTENKIAVGSKGTLRYEIIATGRMAHSAYPHLGESAIDKLLDILQDIRRIDLPVDFVFGPSTLNIGTIEGGRAPNVIPDRARAEILIRLVGDSAPIRAAITKAVATRAELREAVCVPPVKLTTLEGFPETVAAFTTDIPSFDGSWGTPLLIGPGSIHVAHTFDERISKLELRDAVEIYIRMVKILQPRVAS